MTVGMDRNLSVFLGLALTLCVGLTLPASLDAQLGGRLSGRSPHAPHGDRPEMQITREEVTAWMAAAGFELSREVELFEEKIFVIYTKKE